MRSLHAVIAVALLAAAACDEKAAAPTGPASRVEIVVAPLGLPGLSDVQWTVTVDNGADPPARVMQRTVGSAQYGDGQGALSFVGPCDAAANPNVVTLTLAGLVDADGLPIDPSRYAAPPPMKRPITCVAGGDVAVSFDVTVARAAEQGFFDVGVQFDEIFCSAKLDCVGDDGQPIDLLFNGAERDTTVVVAWACTTGGARPTYLHMDAMVLACSDGTRMVHNPSQGPGNAGPAPPYLFQRAVYFGAESVAPHEKCYWNQALGVDTAAIPAGVDCTLTGRATASAAPWPVGALPEGTIRPAITWNVDVIEDGALACGKHRLDDAASGVATTYIGQDGPERFAYSMRCGDEKPQPNGTLCSGVVTGFDDQAVVASTEEGVVVVIGDDVSDPLPLPAGVTLTDDCCLDPCCTEPE